MTNNVNIGLLIKKLFQKLISVLKQNLLKNAAFMFGVTVVNSLGGFLFWLVVARTFTSESAGVASSIISVSLLLSSIGAFGFGFSVIRFLTSSEDPERFFNSVFFFNIISASIVFAFYLIGIESFSPALADYLKSGVQSWTMLVLTVSTGIATLMQIVFLTWGEAKYSFYQASILSITRLLIVAFPGWETYEAIVNSVLIATLIAVVVSVLVYFPKASGGKKVKLQISLLDIWKVFPYSLGNFFAGLFYRLPSMLLPPIVLELLGASSSAHFSFAWIFGNFVLSASYAFATSAFAEGSNDPVRLDKILSKAALYSMGIMLPVVLVIGFSTNYLLLIFGSEYSEYASELLRWLVFSAPFVVINNIYFSGLRVRNKIKELNIVSLFITLVSVGVPVIWLKKIGIELTGMAWISAHFVVFCYIVLRRWIISHRKNVVNEISSPILDSVS